jgi:GNAT superfamily N-acetyltransferase
MDAWIESFRESHAAGPIPMAMYRRFYREVLTWILEREGCQVLVACNSEDENQVFGFLVHETGNLDRRTRRPVPVIHYLFIKQPYRRLGVASELLRAAKIDPRHPFLFTFKTATGTDVIRKKKLGANWSPLLVRFPKRTKPEDGKNEDRDSEVHSHH